MLGFALLLMLGVGLVSDAEALIEHRQSWNTNGEEAVLEARHLAELKLLDQRMRHGNRAVFFCAWSAVLICFLVAVLFLLDLASLPAGLIIALVFIGVMACLSVGLISFLQEVALATKALRVRTEVLSRKSGL